MLALTAPIPGSLQVLREVGFVEAEPGEEGADPANAPTSMRDAQLGQSAFLWPQSQHPPQWPRKASLMNLPPTIALAALAAVLALRLAKLAAILAELAANALAVRLAAELAAGLAVMLAELAAKLLPELAAFAAVLIGVHGTDPWHSGPSALLCSSARAGKISSLSSKS